MLKKISLFVLIIGITLIVGCLGSENKNEKPVLPGEKRPAPKNTLVPKGQTPEQYLNEYYKYYTAGEYKKSYKMLPAVKKEDQTQDEYESSHKSYNVESYSIGKKTEKSGVAVVEVKLKLKQFGEWITTWQFIKNGDSYIVENYAAGSGESKSSNSSADTEDSKDSNSSAEHEGH